MYRDHRIGVVIPAYNEEGFISNVIQTIPYYVDQIYIIDDCSTDRTWEEVQEAAHEDRVSYQEKNKNSNTKGNADVRTSEGGKTANVEVVDYDHDREFNINSSGQLLEQRAVVWDPIGRVRPLQHRENRGAGGSIKTGYLAARADEIDITVTIDGDGQMDPKHMPLLLDQIIDDKADYAKGNRLINEQYRSQMPRFRFFGNAVLTFLTKIASGYWKTMDPQNGYTAISQHALETIEIESMYEYYGYCNDILVKANAHGIRVADVAIPAIYDEEESKISYWTYFRKVSWMLLMNFLWRLKVKYLVLDFHPLALFYLLGALAISIGSLSGLFSLYSWLVGGSSLFVRVSVSFLISLIGIMFIIFAMLFDMRVNIDNEVQIHD